MLAFLANRPTGAVDALLIVAVILLALGAVLHLLSFAHPVATVAAALVAAGVGCLTLAFLVA